MKIYDRITNGFDFSISMVKKGKKTFKKTFTNKELSTGKLVMSRRKEKTLTRLCGGLMKEQWNSRRDLS